MATPAGFVSAEQIPGLPAPASQEGPEGFVAAEQVPIAVSAHTRKRPGFNTRMALAGGMAPAHPDTGAPPPFQLPNLVTPSAILGLGGGMLGSALAGPPGMALGGLAGGGLGGLLEGQKPPQAVLSGLLQSVPGVMEGFATPMMQAGLGTANPAIARTYIAERAAATPQGVARAGQAIARQAGETSGLVAASPYQAPATDLLQAVRARMGRIATQKLHGAANQAELDALEQEFLGDMPANLTAADLHEAKQAAADIAAPAYSKQQAGKIPLSDISQRWHRALADEARARLEQNVPGYAASNDVTEALVRGKPLATRGANQPPGWGSILARRAGTGAVGAAIGAERNRENPLLGAGLGALIGSSLGTPGFLSGAALTLTDPRLQGLLRLAPALAGNAVTNWAGPEGGR